MGDFFRFLIYSFKIAQYSRIILTWMRLRLKLAVEGEDWGVLIESTSDCC